MRLTIAVGLGCLMLAACTETVPPADEATCVVGRPLPCDCEGGFSGLQDCTDEGPVGQCRCVGPTATVDLGFGPADLGVDAAPAASGEPTTDMGVGGSGAEADFAFLGDDGLPPRVRIILTWEPRLAGGSGDAAPIDLDLHLTHPDANGWNRAPLDCFEDNPTPNWDDATDRDDPVFVQDVGDGPTEVIVYEDPEGGRADPRTYRVAVHNDSEVGPAHATVRILVRNREPFESDISGLEAGQFWDVARIRWPDEVERINRLYPAGIP